VSGRSNLEDISVELVHETDKAWLVTDGTIDPKTDKRVDVWVPKSQAELCCGPMGTALWTLTAPEWMLKDKGLL